jgi:hypothetical protein
MESLERLVFHHQVGNGYGLGDRFLGNFAIPLAGDFLPRQAVFELFKDDLHHNAGSFERWLPAANLRIGDDIPSQLDPVTPPVSLRFHAGAPDYAPALNALQDGD